MSFANWLLTNLIQITDHDKFFSFLTSHHHLQQLLHANSHVFCAPLPPIELNVTIILTVVIQQVCCKLVLHLHTETKDNSHTIAGMFKYQNITTTKGMNTCVTLLHFKKPAISTCKLWQKREVTSMVAFSQMMARPTNKIFEYCTTLCIVVWCDMTAVVVSEQLLGFWGKTHMACCWETGESKTMYDLFRKIKVCKCSGKHQCHKKWPSGS